ncbi:hypothetical protein [Cyclobacterium jeungdonense]|uniref:Uncharacterized protein n=1 Tax=Cyclobacterium jeungdonense TaxID=708087 RepID=A0ABT8CCW2_9BACT|nr:hypothetical protein [Cyclobacterium jeungdonense]MDN3689521.1 hypothetical protein [Cyclobacterium jeungdonense]
MVKAVSFNHGSVTNILHQFSINLTGKQLNQLGAEARAFSFFYRRFAHPIITDFN